MCYNQKNGFGIRGMPKMIYEQYPELDALLCSMPGAQRDFKVEWAWDRYLVGGKMFAAMMAPGDKYDKAYANHPLLNLKADPEEGAVCRAQYPDILPGFYADKRCWISIRLDGSVPPERIAGLCRRSYDLVFAKLTKAARAGILAGQNPADPT